MVWVSVGKLRFSLLTIWKCQSQEMGFNAFSITTYSVDKSIYIDNNAEIEYYAPERHNCYLLPGMTVISKKTVWLPPTLVAVQLYLSVSATSVMQISRLDLRKVELPFSKTSSLNVIRELLYHSVSLARIVEFLLQLIDSNGTPYPTHVSSTVSPATIRKSSG